MEGVNKIEAVTERDIDLLLLEELNVSHDFSSWLYSVVTKNYDAPLCTGAWHSISDSSLGESDLVVIYDNGLAILIENKIDAFAQPEQGARYKARGLKGIESALWSSFYTCMIAPSLYLKKEKDASEYSARLSYEEVSNWLKSFNQSDRRAKYRAYILQEAIEQNRRGYTINPDERVTEFWLNYWKLATQKYPELEMKRPGIKPANSDWPDFRPSTLKKGLSIVHKLERGDIDLQIPGFSDNLEYLKNILSDVEVEVVKAGKSAAIRVKVDSLDRFSAFESQKNIVIEGLEAAKKLIEVAKNIEKHI
ncbi:PD-(D/E)XK nuclease family protein [Gilvimarinus sp. DA14]|uniref:PD-(D/E)XK nuclease family protein n=1 Tax=Gilvimarinus sp. DA14 TaxID=2956798 RepID=UPI0020B8E04F|nr:PD-(D/E)XK nuclease family protein [Gilvimarinus sp. DA14]UTF59135.1 PD-(D/E)XK nuclease family protein [Gilvimarinus sp. DA14]